MSDKKYGVKADMLSGGPYANEGFDEFNAYSSFEPVSQTIFLCLRGEPVEGVYEIMINYDHASERPSFWTEDRRALLPPETLEKCLLYYSCGPRKRKGRTPTENRTGPPAATSKRQRMLSPVPSTPNPV